MLIQFTVENFLSYDKPTVFSLVATNDEAHPNHVIHNVGGTKRNLLRAAAIYGANASGKSNLVKALRFAQELIINGTGAGESIPITPFRLSRSPQSSSRFQFHFHTQGVEYSYGFRVTRTHVAEEFLYAKPKGKEVKYFERITSEEIQTEVDFGASLTKGSKGKRDFLKYKADDTRPNQLLLTAISEGNLRDRVEELKPIIDWFRYVLTVIDADATYHRLTARTHTIRELKEMLGNYLRISDTGIRHIETREMPFDWERDLPLLPDPLRNEFIAKYDKERTQLPLWMREPLIMEIGTPNGENAYICKTEQGEWRQIKLFLQHQGKDGKLYEFEINDESDGTQRMINLVPILFEMNRVEEKVIVIDEIDRRMHTHLSRLMIDAAMRCQKQSQLIFTTHDTNLLDLELLRRDEIWFVEKDKTGNSHLYSLAEFKIRPDLQIEKGYLNGRFGAIPFIGDIESLGWDEPASEKVKENVLA
jgi:uncharacterized protein